MLTSKLGEDITRKENYKPISFLNMGETFCERTISQIQQDIKNEFIRGMQGWFNTGKFTSISSSL